MPRNKPAAGWKVALIVSAVLAVLFVSLGGISTGYSTRSVVTLALAGALLGAIAAPDLEPESFRAPMLWQMGFAILGAVMVAFSLHLGPLGYLVAVLVGAVLGYFARYWTKYIDVP